MTSYYHVITIECMIISNLRSQVNPTYAPEILLGKKKSNTDLCKKPRQRNSHHEIN